MLPCPLQKETHIKDGILLCSVLVSQRSTWKWGCHVTQRNFLWVHHAIFHPAVIFAETFLQFLPDFFLERLQLIDVLIWKNYTNTVQARRQNWRQKRQQSNQLLVFARYPGTLSSFDFSTQISLGMRSIQNGGSFIGDRFVDHCRK